MTMMAIITTKIPVQNKNTNTMMRSLVFLLLLTLTSALDIKMTDWSCNETLPVYATEFEMACGSDEGSSSRCTFGQSASFDGVLVYDGIYNTNVQNNLAYMSGDMTFTTLHYDLFDKYEFDLCYDGVIVPVENEDTSGTAAAAECPNDGQYGFGLTYVLPDASETAWLATGFVGMGYLYMYADSSQEELMGSCKFTLQTLVTPDESRAYNPPTARTTGIVLLSLLGVLIATVCYCTCCRGRRRRRSRDDDATTFVRMQDGDERSTAMA